MSKKRAVQPYRVINEGSLTGDLTSEITDCRYLDNLSYQVTWDGTSPVGEIKVQVTNADLEDPAQAASAVWSDLDFGSLISIIGNSGEHFININQNPGAYVRVVYVSTSGDGVLNVAVVAKGMGG